jgi:hypothetical protein
MGKKHLIRIGIFKGGFIAKRIVMAAIGGRRKQGFLQSRN